MGKVVVCYDVKTEKRRSKVRKLAKARGEHHQRSVFLVYEGPIRNLSEALGAFIEEEVDRLLIAPLRGKAFYLGKPFERFRWGL